MNANKNKSPSKPVTDTGAYYDIMQPKKHGNMRVVYIFIRINIDYYNFFIKHKKPASEKNAL